MTADRQALIRQGCCDQMRSQVTYTCDAHPQRYDCPDALVGRFEDGTLGLIIHDGGSSMVEINHCPWCGEVL